MTKITNFVWNSVDDCIISELDGSGAVQAVYTNEPQQYGGVISQRRGTTTSTYHTDALGSTRFLTDSSGNVTDTYLNDAWGNLVAATGTTVNPFKWVGKYGYYTDNSTAHVYVRARMYQPTVARWTSVDPTFELPNAWGFSYVGSDPIGSMDPGGLDFIAIADRPVGGSSLIGYHYSLQWWRCCGSVADYVCSSEGFTEAQLKTKCGRSRISWPDQGPRQEDAFGKLQGCELLTVTGFKAWGSYTAYSGGFPGPIKKYTAWSKVNVWAAVVQYVENGTRIMPILDGDPEQVREAWERVKYQAQTYPWAEQGGSDALAFRGPFKKWPKSLYSALGTNSNTFVRTLAKEAGLPPCELDGSHPGDRQPRQNHETGSTPYGASYTYRFYASSPPWVANWPWSDPPQPTNPTGGCCQDK